MLKLCNILERILSILLYFFKFRVWMTVHGIYNENIFKDVPELFKSYSFLLERSDRTKLGQGFGLSERSVIDIGEWLWYLSDYCPVFWSCLHFFPIEIVAGNWSVILSILCSVISQEVSHECYGFLFWECRYKGKKLRLRSLVGHGYVSLNVTQQNLFETFVIFFQRHLLASQSRFVECV